MKKFHLGLVVNVKNRGGRYGTIVTAHDARAGIDRYRRHAHGRGVRRYGRGRWIERVIMRLSLSKAIQGRHVAGRAAASAGRYGINGMPGVSFDGGYRRKLQRGVALRAYSVVFKRLRHSADRVDVMAVVAGDRLAEGMSACEELRDNRSVTVSALRVGIRKRSVGRIIDQRSHAPALNMLRRIPVTIAAGQRTMCTKREQRNVCRRAPIMTAEAGCRAIGTRIERRRTSRQSSEASQPQ